MNLAEEAFNRLYPDKQINRKFFLKYSGNFKPYNANVKYSPTMINFNLSKSWRKIDKEIQIGLIQVLLVKVFKKKRKTLNIDMYDIFMKKLWTVAPKEKIDPLLLKSFDRVNLKYFNNLVEIPNLVWGSETLSKLGSYEYATDTIQISSLFKNQPEEFIDYIMHHEMIHKQMQYKSSGLRTMHHTAEFRLKEKSFDNSEKIENKIKSLIRSKKLKKSFFRFF